MIEVRSGLFVGWGWTLEEARACLRRNMKHATGKGRRVAA